MTERLSACALLIFGTIGCYRQEIFETRNDERGCWVRVKTSSLASPERATQTLEDVEKNRPSACGSKTNIAVNFHVDQCPRYPYLTARRSRGAGSEIRFWFEGKHLPRDRWGEAESWGNKHCLQDGKRSAKMICASRVTSGGTVEADPVWSHPSLIGTGCQ